MNHSRYARWLFSIAAAYNFICTLPMTLAATPLGKLLGVPPPIDPLNFDIALVLILTFGFGYWQISRDPVGNRPIIVLGIIGKSLVALVGWIAWFKGQASDTGAFIVTGDALFALLFFDFLRRTAPQLRTA